VINATWLFFFLAWIIASMVFPGLKTRIKSTGNFYTHWLPFALLATATGIITSEIFYSLNFVFLPSCPQFAIAGELFFFLSLGFSFWGILTIILKNPYGCKEFCFLQTGPYRYFRHPVYTSVLISFLSVFIIRFSAAALLGMLIAGFLCIKNIKAEEREMVRIFGTRYLHYMTRSWSLFPFIY